MPLDPDLGSETPERHAARLAHAARWRQDEARRRAVMGDAAGTAEGIRRLVAAGELSREGGDTLLAVLR